MECHSPNGIRLQNNATKSKLTEVVNDFLFRCFMPQFSSEVKKDSAKNEILVTNKCDRKLWIVSLGKIPVFFSRFFRLILSLIKMFSIIIEAGYFLFILIVFDIEIENVENRFFFGLTHSIIFKSLKISNVLPWPRTFLLICRYPCDTFTIHDKTKCIAKTLMGQWRWFEWHSELNGMVGHLNVHWKLTIEFLFVYVCDR